jgi:HPt (histidine-containing phosphotransfer) domain-containing protein
MTAHAMQGDPEKCLDAGMDGYLSKPVHIESLREVILKSRQNLSAIDCPPRSRNLADLKEFLRDSCGDDHEMINQILELLVNNTSRQFESLEAAIKAGDHDRISSEAHSLKGAFLAVGAKELASACQNLVDLGHRGDPFALETAYGPIRHDWCRLRDEAAHFLEENRQTLMNPTKI